MDFGRKYCIFVLAKRREPIGTGVSPLFLATNLTYKGCFTSDVEKNRSEIIFFLGGIVFFLGQVVAIVADIEHPKVKRNLFSNPHFFTFGGGKRRGLLLYNNLPNHKMRNGWVKSGCYR